MMTKEQATTRGFGFVRRIAGPDPLDQQTFIAIAASSLFSVILVAALLIATVARGDEVPACPMMTVSEFADRLDHISERLFTIKAATQYGMPTSVVISAVQGIETEAAFLRLAGRCLHDRDDALNRIRSGQ
jgi:hypothetical protein